MTQLQIAVVVAITYPWESDYSAIATQLKFQFAHTAHVFKYTSHAMRNVLRVGCFNIDSYVMS